MVNTLCGPWSAETLDFSESRVSKIPRSPSSIRGLMIVVSFSTLNFQNLKDLVSFDSSPRQPAMFDDNGNKLRQYRRLLTVTHELITLTSCISACFIFPKLNPIFLAVSNGIANSETSG